MKFKKAAFALSLVVGLTFSAVPTGFAANSFKDVPDYDPYVTFVEHLKEKQVTSGIGDGLFAPDNTLTRAEFATFLIRAFQIPTENVSVPFNDIAGHWAESYIKAAFSAKIIAGTSPTTFEPELPVKREEAAVMIWRYLKSQGVPAKTSQLEATDLPDDWALEGVQNICGNGLHGPDVQYYGGARFKPKNNMLRKEMVAMLDKSMILQATLNEAKEKGVTIVNDQLGGHMTPVIPEKGTIIRVHRDGQLLRTITITDILNPVKDSFTQTNADGTTSPANIPVFSYKAETTAQANIDFVNTYGPKYAAAAPIIAQIKAEVTKDGQVNIVLPKADGYTWKTNFPSSTIITGDKMNMKYYEGYSIMIDLDMDSTTNNPYRPAFFVNFKLVNKSVTVFSVESPHFN